MSTEITSEYVIENLKCSFLNCNKELIPSDNNFLYYYQKQNPVEDTQEGIINQTSNTNQNENNSIFRTCIVASNTNQTEIKFICQTCIDEIMKIGNSYYQQIIDNIQLDQVRYRIFLEVDGKDTPNPPKKGKFMQQQQKCKKCLTNEVKMQEFDTSLQTYVCNQNDSNFEIEVAKYYAKEQYKKDQFMFQQLKEKLQSQMNRLGQIERLMILNKMKMIMEKYT